MSLVAGRLSVQAGAHHMEIHQGGNGMLLGGVPGVAAAKVLVLGGGVGSSAIRVALGMGADVTVLDRFVARLGELDEQYRGQLRTAHSTAEAVEEHACQADLIIGAVLIPGASVPKLITGDMLKQFKPGTVMVDVAIDQGDASTSQPPPMLIPLTPSTMSCITAWPICRVQSPNLNHGAHQCDPAICTQTGQ